jgi:uncharacterized protein
MPENRPYGLYAISIALFLSAIAVSGALGKIRRADDAVTVTGSAKRSIRADYAVWKATVSSQSPTVTVASQDLQRHGATIRAFLSAQQIPDSSTAVKAVETQPVNETTGEGRETGRILAYRLSQTFEVRSADVDMITRLSQRASDLMAQGVPLAAQPPEYLFTKLADLRISLLEDATKDAMQRAESITRSTGGSVGAVREARMGVFQITPRFSTEVSDYGVYDLTSVEKDVTAVVRVTFGVKD